MSSTLAIELPERIEHPGVAAPPIELFGPPQRRCRSGSRNAQILPLPVRTPLEPSPAPAPLRLTRRGRALLTLTAVVIVVLVATIAALSNPSRPAAPAPPVVTVQPGDSLWSLALRVAPGADPRVTVTRLERLNGLTSPTVVVGQQLRLR